MDYIPKELKQREGFLGQRMITIPPNIKSEIINNPLIADFYLTAIGYYPKAIYHDRKRKFGSKEYILLYCLEGKGTIQLGDTTYLINPNSFLIIPPHESHHYQSSSEHPWTLFWVHFTGAKATALYNRYQHIQTDALRTISRRERRQKDFFKIMTVLESGYETQGLEYANISLYNLLTQMVLSETINSSELKTDIVSKSIAFMNQHLTTTLKIEVLAKEQQLSVSRYSELFRLKTGYSPIHYFNKLKIQKSCQYLYFTDMKIKDICSEIGYEDPYYYSRAFKKLMGMSPAKYRKEYQTRKNT